MKFILYYPGIQLRSGRCRRSVLQTFNVTIVSDVRCCRHSMSNQAFNLATVSVPHSKRSLSCQDWTTSYAYYVYACTMGSHNFKGTAKGVLCVLQLMSRDIRCNIYIAPEISRDILCNIYISLDVHMTVNIVAKNVSGNKRTRRRTIGNKSTWRALCNNSTQWDKNSIQGLTGNTRQTIGKNSTQRAIGRRAFNNRNKKYARKQ